MFKIHSRKSILLLRPNGSFASLLNESTGLRIVPGPRDGYPFSALIRDVTTGHFEWVRINESYPGTARIKQHSGGVTVSLDRIRLADGTRSSISVRLEINALRDAFEIIPTIDAGSGSHEVTELILMDGTALDLDDPVHERVALPDWGDGKIFHNPREVDPQILWYGTYFRDHAHYYSYTPEFGLDLSYGWMSAYGRQRGLALAFINEKLMAMEFKLSRSRTGIGLGAVFFRIRTYGEAVPFRESTPLRLGRILLIPTEGDWHSAADIYRREYARTFKDVLPAFGTGSTRPRDLDVNLHYGILGAHAQTADSALNLTFDGVVKRVKDFIKRHKVNPARIMVWLYGIGEHGHDRNNPTQSPRLGAAGGSEGFIRMSRELKRMGVGAHVEYTHPWATQHHQPGYDASLDTGKTHKMMGVVTHTALCLDNQKTLDFYDEHVFKPFRKEGVTDMFLDQATLCMGLCQRAHHDHATDVEGLLGAHARGTLRMDRNIRRIFGKDTFISTESHNDLGARHMEMGVNGDIYASRWCFDGREVEAAPEINHYTHPHVLRMVNHGAASSLPLIAISGCNSMLSQLVEDGPAVARYLSFKDAIRKKGIGYPYGFRDDVGLSWGRGNLTAKVFVLPGRGLTVTYHARTDLEDVITVDISSHGGKGKWSLPVSLKSGEYGFQSRKFSR